MNTLKTEFQINLRNKTQVKALRSFLDIIVGEVTEEKVATETAAKETAAKTTEKAESEPITVTKDDLREKAGKLVAGDGKDGAKRKKIKEQLAEMGVKNISSLDPNQFGEFDTFLETLMPF